MRRRDFFQKLGAGSLGAVAGGAIGGMFQSPSAQSASHARHQNDEVSGPLATATVSFGAYPMPLDRLAPPPPGPPPNVHHVIPFLTLLKRGGTVNFAISGFHNIAIYGPGTRLQDVDGSVLIPVPDAPPGFPMLVDDDRNRVFRGLANFNMPADRVEVVHFPRRGTFLVVCAFLPHFEEGMHGFVRVI